MVTSTPQSDPPVEWASDKVDLDELFKNAAPIGSGEGWALPDFFESDEEHAEFLAWLKDERAGGVV